MPNWYMLYAAIVAVVLMITALVSDTRADKLLDLIRDNKGPENVVKKYQRCITISKACWFIFAGFVMSALINYITE